MATQIEDFVILACICLIQYRSVTDGQMDGQTDALHAPARKMLNEK